MTWRFRSDDYNAWGQYSPRHGDWDDRARMAEVLPRGGQDEVRLCARCPFCGKPVEARADCGVCGDETDVAA